MATQKEVLNQVSGTQPDIEREQSLTPKQQVRGMLKSHKNQLDQILPKHVTVERLMQISFHAIANNEKLLQCSQTSLIGAVLQCAQLGLEPNTVLGEAYLIPFWNGRKKLYEVQFVMGYKGMISLARRSGNVKSISANWVCKNDTFEYEYGLDEKLRHIPGEGERGDITHFYAYAHLVGGGHQFWVMTKADVDKARDGSQGYQTAVKYNNDNTPWIAHYEPMGQKTAVRRLFKWLPCSIEMAVAEKLDAQAEYNAPQKLDDVLTGTFEVLDTESVVGDMDMENPPPDAPIDEEAQRRDTQLREWGFWINTDGTPVNKHGELYDRDAHAMNADGAPIVNNDGTFRKRRKLAHPSEGNDSPVKEGEAVGNSSTKAKESSQDSGNTPLESKEAPEKAEKSKATGRAKDAPPPADKATEPGGGQDDIPF